MGLSAMCIFFTLMTFLLCTKSEHDSCRICECYKPVFLLHGVTADKYYMVAIEERMKLAHPGTIVCNTNAYPDLLSIAPCWDQIRGTLGQVFRNFSDKYPCGIICVGHSQGALLMRGLIQDYSDHNCHTFISLAGPLCGQYGIPPLVVPLQSLFRDPRVVSLTQASNVFYTAAFQKKVSVANYWRDPHRLPDYFRECVFLPKIDNEVPSNRSCEFKANFEKLKFVVLVAGPDDAFIQPWESGHCGFFDENQNIIPYYKRDIYLKNLFGLYTLHKEKRLIIYTRIGVNHDGFLIDPVTFEEAILPYLASNPYPCYNATIDIDVC